jgi:EAL domain-containing protein (putative c-di-GMP-specific phosphodiesterase class I)
VGDVCYNYVKINAKSIIDLAHNLEMKTIAEGVETKEQFELLKSLGCDFIQGFWLAKPMPISELVAFIESWEHKKIIIDKVLGF